ncbi:MAG TPA: TIGR01777 family oxidoreductase [Humidesulfovibrio sp.]|uniref:TIGR01777 family oxidoreductase n=1 Tax=Humidesulfovibrio sp. TaxID=2910988 RepID=UPI002CA8C55C|nr:TIGR01777 family oxidoreductase [Humidesulfovibrio sp.]HWR03375.1 TIGR01777 family oxidoreductase [Humidesulfovibrio sp.]
MRIIILGGTGFVGTALTRLLVSRGHEVVIPSRRPEKVAALLGVGLPHARIVGAPFDGKTGAGWADFITPDTAIVNLAGENIAAGRWTPEVKARIEGSRLAAGAAVMDALKRADALPAVLVQASAVGFYGARGTEPVDESAGPGDNFLAHVATGWEASTRGAEELGVRRAVIRTSMVLGKGGALEKMLPPFRLGLGGPLGNGRQMVPFIHLDDEAGAIAFLIETPGLSGPFNLAAPQAVDSRDFAEALGRALGRPAFLPAPAFALKLLLGQMAEEVLLSGVNAVPARLLAAGYRFRHPTLAGALEAALAAG